jgi:SAM-dependent methyltransferase
MSEPAAGVPKAAAHYDAIYFEWQKHAGRLGGWANIDKFRDSIEPASRVLDFGCGGGFLLANLACGARFGIEPNDAARETAKGNCVAVFANASEALDAIGPEAIDVVISDNALEHALEPWRELTALLPLLKRGGRIHIVVPCEGIGWKYRADDINQHVYSWSPQSLGNLLKAAGYEVEYSRPYIHKWPPRVAYALSRMGRPIFNFCARVWGHIDRRWFQVEVVATRPVSGNG